jgi:hypothetical protein
MISSHFQKHIRGKDSNCPSLNWQVLFYNYVEIGFGCINSGIHRSSSLHLNQLLALLFQTTPNSLCKKGITAVTSTVR